MADKNIGALPQADQLYDDSKFVLEHSGTAKHVTGRQFKDYAKEGVQVYVEAAQNAAQDALDAVATIGTAVADTQANKEAAQAAQNAAETAEQGAVEARTAIENMLVDAVTLATGEPATVTKELVDGVVKLVFGLPEGPKGIQGDTGSSIQSIVRTSGTGAAGTVDTYTITMTEGATSTFQVYNGADGIGAGDMLAATYDPQKKNTDVFAYADSAAEMAASGKQDKLTGAQGQVVGFDQDGNAVPQEAPEGGVVSFNGRGGVVVPQDGDYTAAQVGARPEEWMPTLDDLSAVGRSMAGQSVEPVQGTIVTAGEGAEVFNDYLERLYDDAGLATQGNIASGKSAHAEGGAATASGANAHAEGFRTKASGSSSHAEGGNTTASGSNSHAEGSNTTASGYYSHAEGSNTTASGNSSHAEGSDTTASGNSSHAEGSNNTTASGSGSHAEGSDTTASGNYSHAENAATIAACINAHAEGSQTIAAGTDIILKVSSYNASSKTFVFDSTFIGFSKAFSKLAVGVKIWVINNAYYDSRNIYTVSTINQSAGSITVEESLPSSYSAGFAVVMVASTTRTAHAEGWRTTAIGASSHAEGDSTTASGTASHAEGAQTTASSLSAHAEGFRSLASNQSAHAEGSDTTASGNSSHAEGSNTTASGNYSHAEGYGTIASGDRSHAEGSNTTASGDRSHAEGINTTASGSNSHASGENTIANALQFVIGAHNVVSGNPGSWNYNDNNYLIIGGGNSDVAKKNIFRVNNNGVYASGPYNSSGADYAELFEWADGNPDTADRAGLFVTLDGDHIRIAQPGDQFILGIISSAPSVVGDVYDDQWAGMHLRDVFGRTLYEERDFPAELDSDGEVIQEARRERAPVLNPDYNLEEKYIARTQRPEWDAVGLMGKLVAVDDGTCVVNGYCTVGTGGVATRAEGRTPYRVMARLDENHVRLLIL